MNLNDNSRLVLREEMERAFYQSDRIFYWDGRNTMPTIAHHVHGNGERCIKRRTGVPCNVAS